MPHDGSLLQGAVVFLCAAVLAVPLAKRLQLGAVLGYLLAGVLIGPSVLGLIGDPESVSHLSELGVVLLLFIIGLELSPKRLWVMRQAVFGVGLAQVLLTALVIGAVALFGFQQPLPVAMVLGLGLALSSTAFGLQLLSERRDLTSPHGRMAFAILLFQDIAAIPLIALVPMLGDASPHPLPGNELQGLLEVFGSIALVVLGGRYLLRPVFRIVSKSGSHEVSTATALLVVIGTAWLMELAGISMALGAFLAGMLLADSEYRHELESHIEPFKGLLLGLFFMSVGMVANLQLLWQAPLLVLGLTLLLISLKLPVLLLVGRLAGGLSRGSAMQLAVLLAAGGEFAFVVFRMARNEGLLDAPTHDLLVIAITLSMALTPLLVMLVAYLFKTTANAAREVPPELETVDSQVPRVVLAGMGRVGQVIARVLRAQHVPFVALDNSVDAVEMSRRHGQMPIFYGNPLRPEILRAAQVDKAEWFIVATDDPDTNLKTTELVRKLYPHVKVIARARNRQHVHKLWDLNALAVRETFHSSLEMSHQVLRGLGLSEEQAAARLRRFRRHDEEVLEAQHRVYDNQAQVQQTTRQASEELENLFSSDQIEERRGD